MSIITNRELRDLWADAAKIKEAISGGKVAVADAAVLAKLEAMRGLLAGTLSTADSAVLAKLADLEAKLDTILNGTTPAAVQLTGSIVQDDRLRVAQRDTIDLAVLAKLMADTADGTLITDLIKAAYGRTLLLLKPYADNVIWTRSSPSTAYWAVGTWKKASGSKLITASTGTGPTASGASNQIKFGSGGVGTMAEYVFDLDFTGVKTLNIYTKLEEFGRLGSQIIISINDTQIYSSGPDSIAREHDWTLRTFDVSGYTGVLPLKITTRAGYTGSEPLYQFGNLTLEV